MSFRPHALTLFTFAGLLVGTAAHAGMAQEPATGATSGTSGTSSTTDHNLGEAKMLKPQLSDGPAVEYRVEHPSWRESKAVRVLNPKLPHMNVETTIYSRIVVGVESEEALKAAIASVGAALGTSRPGSHTFSQFLGESGVYIVEGNSVEDAINMANELAKVNGILWTEVDHRNAVQNDSVEPSLAQSTRGVTAVPDDPSYGSQWHYSNSINPGNDHKIGFVHNSTTGPGLSGLGVVVGIIEAFDNSFYRVDQFGTEFIHSDLESGLRRDLSSETNPFQIDLTHGVSVAGIIGARGYNGLAGAGVAFNAELASLRGGGSGIDSGQSFAHELQNIDIINNSWGPVNATTPATPIDNSAKYLLALPDDYEITIPQVTHSGPTRTQFIGLDQGIRLSRGNKGRIYVFSAGNRSHFLGFGRMALGNAISLPGIGTSMGAIAPYGLLDITSFDPADNDGDGIPEAFDQSGTVGTGWRWSGHLGDRVDYKRMHSMERTFAIAAVDEFNNRASYSSTGVSIFAGAYSQGSLMALEWDPATPMAWPGPSFGRGITTLEMSGDGDSDSGSCATSGFADDDLETCQFNGTSAAAPVAAGIMALMLEANPNLNIRDMQHIIQLTSRIDPFDGSVPPDGDFIDAEDFSGLNYSATDSYWTSVILGLGALDVDDGSPPTPTFWTSNSAGIRHSDEFGFGVMDARAAVAMAATWNTVGKGFILDSEVVEIEDGEIEDAVFEQVAIISDNLETNRLVPGTRSIFALNCVRSNMIIEGIELTLTIEGDGAGDLLIALRSPRGTISPLALPRGDSNNLNGFAYNGYTFTTYKHWGELSGGNWDLIIQDFRPDDDSPEGDPPADPPDPDDLGIEQVTYLGAFGLPGEAQHSEKTLISYRMKIFADDGGDAVFEGCPPLNTSCPGDLDGNGIIDINDFFIFLHWFNEGNTLADLNGDGLINIFDVFIYRSLWQPGFCNASGLTGGRPAGFGGAGTDPIIRPI